MKSAEPGQCVLQIYLRLSYIDAIGFERGRRTIFRIGPIEIGGGASKRRRGLDGRVGDGHAGRERAQGHARIEIERRIIRPQSQIPSVEFAQLRTGLQGPDVALRFGMHHRRDISAYAKIVATKEPEHVGDGGFAPGQVEYRRAQPRRSAAQTSGKINRARSLQDERGARGRSLQVYAPAARSVGFDVAIHGDEGEWDFFIAALEIDATGIDFEARETDARQTRGVRVGRHGRRRGYRWARQPFSKIPLAHGI